MSIGRSFRHRTASGTKTKNAAVSMVCSLALVVSMCPGFAVAAYADTNGSDSKSISIESYDENSNYTVSLVAPSEKSVKAGSSFEIQVVGSAANNAVLSCASIDVTYDSDIVTLGESNITSSVSNFSCYDDGKGKAALSFYGNTSKMELSESGLPIATLKFTVMASAKAESTIDIKITDGIAGASGDMVSGNKGDQGVKFSSEDLGITVAEATTIQRVAGNEARDTSAKIATTAWEGSSSEWAILARDDDFADAMSATGLAGALNAPIVLTDREGLSDVAKQTLQSLGVKNVYIAGGTGAMPGDFESELKAAGVTGTIERVYGYESYDTSVKCAEKIVEIDSVKGISAQYAIVAMPSNFQDALSMSSFAYKYHAPIFLQTYGSVSSERSLTAEAQALLTGTGAYAKAQVFVAGGNGAVSDDSLSFLKDYVRIGGWTGYDTSNAIATYMVKNNLLAANTVCVASGAELAKGLDALSGAALAGKNNGVMLLVNAQEGMEELNFTTINAGEDSLGNASFLTANKDSVDSAYVLGGTYVIPADAYTDMQKIINAVDVTKA